MKVVGFNHNPKGHFLVDTCSVRLIVALRCLFIGLVSDYRALSPSSFTILRIHDGLLKSVCSVTRANTTLTASWKGSQ